METILWGVLIVGLSVALALLGFVAARRFVPFDLRETHNANTAVMFGALYVLYGLIVGFSAYFVAYQYDTAQKTAQTEAGSVEEIHSLAEGFPEAKRRELQGLAEAYARAVVEEGWPLMRKGRSSVKVENISDEFRSAVLDFEFRTEREDALYAQALTLVADLDEGRALRLQEAREGIPSILWVVLVLGGVVTVLFTYLLGIRAEGLHAFMIAAYTVVLALILYAIWALDYPFDGLVQISSNAFEEALSRMESSGGR